MNVHICQFRNPLKPSPALELRRALDEEQWMLRLARRAGLSTHVRRHERAVRCLELALAGIEGGLP